VHKYDQLFCVGGGHASMVSIVTIRPFVWKTKFLPNYGIFRHMNLNRFSNCSSITKFLAERLRRYLTVWVMP